MPDIEAHQPVVSVIEHSNLLCLSLRTPTCCACYWSTPTCCVCHWAYQLVVSVIEHINLLCLSLVHANLLCLLLKHTSLLYLSESTPICCACLLSALSCCACHRAHKPVVPVISAHYTVAPVIEHTNLLCMLLKHTNLLCMLLKHTNLLCAPVRTPTCCTVLVIEAHQPVVSVSEHSNLLSLSLCTPTCCACYCNTPPVVSVIDNSNLLFLLYWSTPTCCACHWASTNLRFCSEIIRGSSGVSSNNNSSGLYVLCVWVARSEGISTFFLFESNLSYHPSPLPQFSEQWTRTRHLGPGAYSHVGFRGGGGAGTSGTFYLPILRDI